MRASTFIASALYAASTTASTLRIAAPTNWTWQITNWESGCVRSGCYYNFNVSIPASPAYPKTDAVKAYCNGYETDGSYTACKLLEGPGAGNATNSTGDGLRKRGAKVLRLRKRATELEEVAAKFLAREEGHEDVGPRQIAVSLQVEPGDGSRWNFTGFADVVYNAFVAPQRNVSLTPSEAWAVA